MRIFLIVLDSFGIGEAPDADKYGDLGASTLRSLYESKALNIPNLNSLGLCRIDGVELPCSNTLPHGAYGRFAEASVGKDTTTGHFEIAGIRSERAMPTYPCGFPKEIMEKFERTVGVGTLCNLPYSGTAVIEDYGREHLESGKLIVYTSADSVFQIAAHEELYPPKRLYEICRSARELLTGEHSVGRVIARPFITENGKFVRTGNRRDFSLEPPRDTLLDILTGRGVSVISVGKIYDIFAGRGISEAHLTHDNREGMEKLSELAELDFEGLCFANLVDFDSKFGHRQDPVGYAEAISLFDEWLGAFIPRLKDDDILMITADHGCDPADDSTDHTREYIPFLAYGRDIAPVNLGTGSCFADIGATVCDLLLGENLLSFGKSFKNKILAKCE